MDFRQSADTVRRRGFSLAGLLLIAVGLVLLLNTTGSVGLAVWFELAGYWPVLLVLIGVKMFLAPRAPLICLGLICLILAGTIAAASIGLTVARQDDLTAISFEAPLANTEELHLGMGFTGGRVSVREDWNGSGYPGRLLAADFNDRPAEVIYDRTGVSSRIYLSTNGPSIRFGEDSRRTGDGYASDSPGPTADRREERFSFDRDYGWSIGGMADWELLISPDVILDLEIRAGAADLDLDLRGLNVRRLVIGAGASDIHIILPERAGETQVDIAAGAVEVDIMVPRGVAARISNDAVLGSTRVDSSRFPETSGVYRSRGYATAENRVSIEIEGAAADITVS